MVFSTGVTTDPIKINAMLDWPPPTSTTELRGFLGLTGFYRHFICNYAAIASLFTSLLHKDQSHWSTDAQLAFLHLNEAMKEAPVLVSTNFALPFILETNMSGIAMGVVLQQQSHPIAFFSKVFCPQLKSVSTYIRELVAITLAVWKWRHYLLK